jgi:transcriptional regulator with XRE-family HTH domain
MALRRPNVRGMRNERALFAARLRNYLETKKFDARPVELMKVLARFGFVSVTQQTISGWLSGKHMPNPDAMRALSRVLGIDPHDLQYGARMTREVREPNTAWPDHLTARIACCSRSFCVCQQSNATLCVNWSALYRDQPRLEVFSASCAPECIAADR